MKEKAYACSYVNRMIISQDSNEELHTKISFLAQKVKIKLFLKEGIKGDMYSIPLYLILDFSYIVNKSVNNWQQVSLGLHKAYNFETWPIGDNSYSSGFGSFPSLCLWGEERSRILWTSTKVSRLTTSLSTFSARSWNALEFTGNIFSIELALVLLNLFTVVNFWWWDLYHIHEIPGFLLCDTVDLYTVQSE